MNWWLVKTEPDTYAWGDLVKEKTGTWDGVRNFQARKNLQNMKKGDLVLIYHTGDEKAVVGIAKVVKEGYPEPKDKDWTAVDLSPVKQLKRAVALSEIKASKKLAAMVLVKVSRLSVQPVREEEFDWIVALSEE
ncbi:MAG: EVE domain-containing protein [Cyclobacteriaceae bacterium]|nr:EVE domain-containing protein [Cyclobacteriaceae bacterium]